MESNHHCPGEIGPPYHQDLLHIDYKSKNKMGVVIPHWWESTSESLSYNMASSSSLEQV